jgi:hypothetical protein
MQDWSSSGTSAEHSSHASNALGMSPAMPHATLHSNRFVPGSTTGSIGTPYPSEPSSSGVAEVDALRRLLGVVEQDKQVPPSPLRCHTITITITLTL